MKLNVLRPFKDKLDHKTVYKAGAALLTDDLKRINDLVARGLCEIASVEEESKQEQPVEVIFGEKNFPLEQIKAALRTIGVKIASNAGEKGVDKVLAMLTEEQDAALWKELTGDESPVASNEVTPETSTEKSAENPKENIPEAQDENCGEE